ncbi:MAG: universal stress protein [Nitrosomonas sp.]|nr:universal stress protein [Nitrosomonas sp.]MCP5250256.1 universal stress protein [Burkholderiales bacterium]HQU63527.1 universal stress protein [Nitrosomonas sp.]
MYQRILVPIDGSSNSERALQEAIKFAQFHHAHLMLVHVLEDIQYAEMENYINYAEILKSFKDSARKMLEKASQLVRQADVEVSEKLLVASGRRVAHVLVEEASQWPADLIIIGTHGRSGFNRLLLGSIAESVLRLSPVPVLLIRSETE